MPRELKPDEFNHVKEFIDSQLDLARVQSEFILSEVPKLEYTNIVTDFITLQQKIQEASKRFLTIEMTLKLQRKLLDMFISWNPFIEKQLSDFHNYYVDLNKFIRENAPLTGKDYNPFELVLENRDKFIRANNAYFGVLNKYNHVLIDDVELYSFFYCIIASVESMEYPLYEKLRMDLIKYNLDTKYDVDSIFSVTTKKKARNSKTGYQTDSRMIRNALGHFDYTIDDRDESFIMTFNSLVDPNESIIFNIVEFGKFIQNHRLLLQSIHCIHGIMAAFSNVREYFCTDV